VSTLLNTTSIKSASLSYRCFDSTFVFSYQSSVPQELHVTNDNAEAMRVDFKLTPVETNYDGISSYYNPYFLRH